MTTIELALKLLKYDLTRKQLMSISRRIDKLGKDAKEVNPKMVILGATIGKLVKVGAKWLRHLGQTFESAVLRTLSYGLITLTRQIKDDFIQAMKEAHKSMLNLARAAVIATRGNAEFEQSYRQLISTAFNASKLVWLSGEQIASAAVDIAKGGGDINQIIKYLDNLGVASALTGEDINKLALDTVRLKEAFKVGDDEIEELAASTVIASTTAVGTINSILQSAKFLAPMLRSIYGDGMKAAKSLMAIAMTGTAAGVKGSQMARWMRRALFQIIAPTKKTRLEFAKFGIQVFEATAASSRYVYELSRVGDKIQRLHDQIDVLTIRYNELKTAGLDDEAAELKEKIDELNKELYRNEKSVVSLYNKYLEAGGKVKPITKLMAEFERVAKSKEGYKFLDFLNKAFTIRTSQGIMTIALNADKLREVMEELKDPVKKVSDMITKLAETAPGKVLLAMNAFDKLKKVIGAIGVETLWAPIGEAFRKHVAIPLTEFFAKPEVQEGLKKYGEIIARDLETIAELMKKPEGGKAVQIELEVAWDKLFADINKILGPFLRVFFEIGKLVGKALGQGMTEAFIPEWIRLPWRATTRFTKVGVSIGPYGAYAMPSKVPYQPYWSQFERKPTTPLTQIFAQELANIKKRVDELSTEGAREAEAGATEKVAGALEGAKEVQEKTTKTLEETTIYFVKNGEKIELITSELGEAMEAMKKTGRVLEAYAGNFKKVAEMINKVSNNDRVITEYIKNVDGKVEAIKAWIRRQTLQSKR